MIAEGFARPLTSLADFTRAMSEVHRNRVALAATVTEEFALFVPAADVNKMLLQQHDMYGLANCMLLTCD